jgi:membrane-bound lytic murein transglycosylase D
LRTPSGERRIQYPLLLLFSILAVFFLRAPSAADATPPFERPPELERDIQFWIRVYTEVTTDAGLLHDDWNLGVVYEVMHFDPQSSPRERARKIDEAKKHYKALLGRFAAGNKSDLTDDEQRILNAFGEKATAATFKSAMDGVRFQLGQANRFREGLMRAGIWESHIARVLTQRGVPAEIAALPHVESSFNPAAYSKVGAAGLWQFMPSTARRYMRVDSLVDERMDPFTATEAAANLMLYNYRLLGTWPLAITAYNHGPGGLLKAQADLGTSNIATVVKRYNGATFGFASRNFYVAFLAALDVDRNAEKYFGPIQKQPDAESTTVELPDYIPMNALVQAFDVDLGAMHALNPALRPPIWSGARFVPRGYALRIPGRVSLKQVETALERVPPSQRYLAQRGDDTYRVRRGDTIERIAQARGIGVDRLLAANGWSRSQTVMRGQVLRMPPPISRAGGPAVVATPVLAAAAPANPAPETLAEPKSEYVVRPGDSLSTIAQRVGIGESDIKTLNGLRDADFIYPGQHLKLMSVTPAAAPATLVAHSPPLPPAPPVPASPAAVPKTVATVPKTAAAVPTAGAATPPAVAAGGAAPHAVAAVSSPETGTDAASLFPEGVPNASADPADYSVGRDNAIIVQAAETLGHYADWAGVSTAKLRALNRLHKGSFVSLGSKVKLDLSKTSAEQFEATRREYHKSLQDAYFATHRISGTEIYTVKKGESLWTITQQRVDLPVWLIRQYNPRVDFSEVRPGSTITLPKVALANRQ